MKSLEIIVIDYHRPGNAVRIANACCDAVLELDLDCEFHVLCPPESGTAREEFPEGTHFWPLDRNHGAQQRYSLAGEIKSAWSLYVDNDLIPTTKGLRKLVEAASEHGENYSCYGWLGHNIENVHGAHLRATESPGLEVDFILRAYLYRSQRVKEALLDFPIFHWEDDLNMQLKIQHRLRRPSWVVADGENFIDLGGGDAIAHHRQPGHFERRTEMVAGRISYRGNQSKS